MRLDISFFGSRSAEIERPPNLVRRIQDSLGSIVAEFPLGGRLRANVVKDAQALARERHNSLPTSAVQSRKASVLLVRRMRGGERPGTPRHPTQQRRGKL
jgi:hypothetical protein